MSSFKDIVIPINTYLRSDAVLQGLFNNKIVLRYQRALGDERAAYICYDFYSKGMGETPVINATLKMDVWDFTDDPTRSEAIADRLVYLLHNKWVTNGNIVKARFFFEDQYKINTNHDRTQRRQVVFRMRYYDLNIHEAEVY